MKQPEDKHLTTGKTGEEMAAQHLTSKGFKVICQNYWKPWGEIDIVAKKGNTLHFIEVKTVSRERWEPAFALEGSNVEKEGIQDNWEPEDNVHSWKKQRLAKVVETYLGEYRVPEEVEFEIDVMAVYLDREGKLLKIDGLEDIKLL